MGRPRKNAVQTKDTTTTASKGKAKEPEEETENLSLTLTRSRRTPKPNPKYQNDVILPFSSRIVTGDSSRSTTPAKSETSEEVVPLSDEDDEDLTKTGSGKKRGRPPKKTAQVTSPAVAPEPAAKKVPPPQPKGPEKKDTPRRLPDRSAKQQTPPEAPVQKRKREEETNEVTKKKVKSVEEKKSTPILTKTQQQQQPVRSVEKKSVPGGKNPSPTKGDIVDVAGTRENVKIVDVSEILKKKHEVVVEEPNKRIRKCPPEVSPRPPPLYSSKILSQSQKVSPSSRPQQAVTPTIRPKISPKAPLKLSPPGPRQLNSNGKFNINNVARHFVAVTPPKCPVIDLTRSGDSLESPQRPKKPLMQPLNPIRKSIQRPMTVPAPLRPLSQQKKPTILSSVKVPVMKKKPVITPLPPAKTPPGQPVLPSQKKREVMTIEKWNVVQLPMEKLPDVAPKVSLGMTLKELEDQIKDIQLPTEAWNHNVPDDYTEPPTTIAFQRMVPGASADDPSADAADEAPSKFDRSVTFKDMEIVIEIEGSEVTLVGAPDTLTTVSDVQTLLQIVNDLTLKNSCVEEVTVVL
ncbi:proteoglycan 4 [Phlebotomus papatasi]|uniref:proteoglycan 4 n=1 Tax=Phlebotomus papatasi TaxID=29031 RepID=UPI0024844226|nr:proteoglycan 4 [Phlebotomus papatasi]